MKRFSPFILAVALLAGREAIHAQGSMLLKGGYVYTITGPTLKNADILILKGKIEKVGHGLTPPSGAKTINLAGKTVMPGLVMAENTYDFGSRPPEGVDVYSTSLRFALSAGITAVFSNGYIIKPTYKDPSGLLLAQHRVFRLSRTSWMNRYELRQNLLAARAYLRDVSLYEAAKQTGGNVQPPRLSSSVKRYVDIITGRVPVHVSLTRAQDILRATALAREFNINLVIEDATEGWTVASEIGRAKASVLFSTRRERPAAAHPDDAPGSSVKTPAIYRKAGVPFALVPPGSGLSITGGPAGRGITSLMMEAAFAVRGGLDEQTALAAITIEPAKILGVSHRIGSIEEGKDADLIILDGDPLHWKTFVTTTIINGKIYYEQEKDKLLPRGRMIYPSQAAFPAL